MGFCLPRKKKTWVFRWSLGLFAGGRVGLPAVVHPAIIQCQYDLPGLLWSSTPPCPLSARCPPAPPLPSSVDGAPYPCTATNWPPDGRSGRGHRPAHPVGGGDLIVVEGYSACPGRRKFAWIGGRCGLAPGCFLAAAFLASGPSPHPFEDWTAGAALVVVKRNVP